MTSRNERVRTWLAIGTLVALCAACCFVVLGVTHVVSPVTAIGNAIGFAITCLVLMVLRKRSWKKC